MPKVDCCGRDLAKCDCHDRSRSGERRERERQRAEKDKVDADKDQSLLSNIAKLLDEKLELKLDPMNKKLDSLLQDFTDFKQTVRKELESVGTQIATLDAASKTTADKMKNLEDQMAQLKNGGGNTVKGDGKSQSGTALVGNIPGAGDLKQAQEWIIKLCKSENLVPPADIYIKSDKFEGFVFTRYGSEKERDDLIERIQKTSTAGSSTTGSKRLYAKPDLPLDMRTADSTLFAIKRMLASWGFAKNCIQVDTAASTLSVAGKEIVKITVKEFKLILEWQDGEWETWEALTTSEELTSLTTERQSKLDKAKAFATNKGKGKSSKPS